MNEQEEIARKIQALLAKAEGTDNEHERDAYLAKAAALQLKYAVDMVMLQNSGKKDIPIISRRFVEEKNTPLVKAKRELIAGLAGLNRCSAILMDQRAYVMVTGFEDDLNFVSQMYTSLLLQMQSAMAREEKKEIEYQNSRSYDPTADIHKKWLRKKMNGWRVSFAHGYVLRVYIRLQEAKLRTVREAEDTVPGSALALITRERRVQEALSHIRTRKNSYATGAGNNSDGWYAGKKAADNADLGHTRVGAGRRTQIS